MESLKKFGKHYELLKVNGRIEVLGESDSNRGNLAQMENSDSIIKQSFAKNIINFRNYDYIRFFSKDGSVEMIKKVSAANLVDSYLQPGLDCELYLLKSKDGYIVLAVKEENGRFVNESEEVIDSLKSTIKKASFLFILLGALAALTGIPLILVFIGLIISPCGILLIIAGLMMRPKVKQLPSADEVLGLINA